MTLETPPGPAPSSTRRAGAVAFVVVLAALAWVAWFAWDTTYVIDADGNQSGPYEVWQVVGAVITLLVLTVAATTRLHTLSTALAVTAGFTAAFAVSGATSDESGLWLVGTILVGIGLLIGSAVVAGIALRLRGVRA